MNLTEHLAADATQLAALVACRELPAEELLALALGQLTRVQPRINAVCWPLEFEARAQLAGPPLTGVFAGVPFLLKDGLQDLAGVPTGYGCAGLQRKVPTESSFVVQRYLAAGLVIFGKTTMPEFALKAVTDPQVSGRTNKPWDPTRTPGGSSGGAAAAVAAGIVPMAAGTDGGGSLRIPTACCGLFGLRP